MNKRLIAVIDHQINDHTDLNYLDNELFSYYAAPSLNALKEKFDSDFVDLLLIDNSHEQQLDPYAFEAYKNYCQSLGIPIVVMVKDIDLKQKMLTLEAGCQDIICRDQAQSEITARLLAIIYHRVANEQLRKHLQQANQAANSAINESNKLTNNIQFLLNTHQCTNLDQLGQVFFQAIQQYQLHCSLQMRSIFSIKNMDANGMARHLESELLHHLKDTGHDYSFDHRCILNYGHASILIKNMPSDKQQRHLIKDCTLTLLKGVDARIKALDEHSKLEQEKDILTELSHGIPHVMKDIETDFHSVMIAILDVIEDMAEKLERGISTLLLSESQEKYIENTIAQCIENSSQVFNNGLKIEKHFRGLEDKIQEVLKTITVENSIQKREKVTREENKPQPINTEIV